MADESSIIHLLRRTETVVRPSRLSALTPLTLDEAIDDVFDFALNPAVTYPPELDPESWESRDMSLQWWVNRMVTVPRPLQEKLTMMWHGHFVVSWDKIGGVTDMLDFVDLLRQNAAGDLVALTQQMALMPAMLDYLDNRYNSKWGPNQNFARELMELFTLGVGNYTEDDVVAAARAWTGHSIDWETGLYTFYPDDHDDDPKTFFGTTKNWDGPDIITEILVDNAVKQGIAARFIAKRVFEHFATPVPNAPGADRTAFLGVIDIMAEVLIAEGMQLAPMIKTLFGHSGWVSGADNTTVLDVFYGTTVRNGLVRTPTDFAVALSHHTGVAPSEFLSSWSMDGTGQVPFWPPNVSGWRPNGYWVNTTAFGARGDMVGQVHNTLEDDIRSFVDANIADPAAIFDHFAAMFFRDPATEITAETRTAIEGFLGHPDRESWWSYRALRDERWGCRVSGAGS